MQLEALRLLVACLRTPQPPFFAAAVPLDRSMFSARLRLVL
jgi:hypothetical protein